jgi:hypothetical protein
VDVTSRNTTTNYNSGRTSCCVCRRLSAGAKARPPLCCLLQRASGVKEHARFKVTAGASAGPPSVWMTLGEAPWRSLQAEGWVTVWVTMGRSCSDMPAPPWMQVALFIYYVERSGSPAKAEVGSHYGRQTHRTRRREGRRRRAVDVCQPPQEPACTDSCMVRGHSRGKIRLTSALRLKTAVGGQITFTRRGPVALLRPAARFGSWRLRGWRFCYLSAARTLVSGVTGGPHADRRRA